ncbi:MULTISPECIES: response regulator [unclassified Roseibium]|uniref:response regulator n=1 Tax=unclassified Roseibium TaxID=2629323 RepID=UPI00273E049C|nr:MULTISPECIES: response regulator [unclassified Roseibium]
MIKTIVMAEDDEDDRRIFHNLLAPHDDFVLSVFTCPLLSTCMRVVFEKRPDLVILDLNLPDSRGLETLQRLVGRFPAQKVLVVTGDLDKEYENQLIENGAVGAFEKASVTVGDFRSAIAGALGGTTAKQYWENRSGSA